MTLLAPEFSLLVLTIAVVMAVIVVALTVSGAPVHRLVGGRPLQWSMITRQQDMAEVLGVDLRVWIVMRCVAAVAALGFADYNGLPPVFLGLGSVLGWVGLPWLMGLEYNRRRLRLDAAWLELERDICDRLKGRTPLNRILRDLGTHPPPVLSTALTPLADTDLDLGQALAEVQRRTRSDIGNRLTAYLVLGVKKDVVSFGRLLPSVIDPFLAGSLHLQRSHGRLVRMALGTTTMLAGILVAELTLLVRSGGGFQAFYAAPVGAVFVLALAAAFVVIVHLIRVVYRLPRGTRWNVSRLVYLLRRYS
jgi:hypothetical protein